MTYDPNYSGVIYDNNGMERHYHSGRLHRTDGPAVISYTGVTWFYLHGKPYTFPEWCTILNKSSREITVLRIEYGIT